MIKIQRAKLVEDFKQISKLATRIWFEHYTPIIGEDQVIYMLNKYQSVDAITEQISSRQEYYLLFYNEKPSGYFCIYEKNDSLFLSKLYVLSDCRDKGLGKLAMTYIETQAKAKGVSNIALTVNKNNVDSIKAYEKMGFIKVEPIIIAIGNGFIMDDFLMKKEILKNEF